MPFQFFESITSMTEEEIVKSLKSSLTELNWLGLPKGSGSFFGVVSTSSFRIMRVVKGRDSFNPMLYGRFHASSEGTRIKVLITYHPVVWLFMLGWTALLGSSILQGSMSNNKEIIPLLLMLIFPWALGIPLFYNNATKSKKLIQRRLRLTDL